MDPPLAKPPKMVLMVPRRGVDRGDVGAGRFRFLVGGLGGVSVATGVMLRVSMVGSRGVTGSRGRGMVISMDETAKVANTDQLFYFILECFAFFCSVAMVAVIAAIFGHVNIRRGGCLAWWRD